jgi:hypothetical protein
MKFSNLVSFCPLAALLAVAFDVGSVVAETNNATHGFQGTTHGFQGTTHGFTGIAGDKKYPMVGDFAPHPFPPSGVVWEQGGATINTNYTPTVVTPPAPVGLPSVRILSEAESMLLEQQALIACAVGRGVFLETRISHPLLPNGGASIRTCRPAQEAIRLFEEQVEVIRKQQR